MKKIIAFAGSNSKKSINKELANYTASLLENVDTKTLDLNEYPLPIYGVDIELENKIPKNATKFLNEIKNADGIILSLAEHNGNFSVAFKNILDWMSRIEAKLWSNKPILLMATSPGGRGGTSALLIAKERFPYMGGNIVADFLLPNFYDNFKEGTIVDKTFKSQLIKAVSIFKTEL